MYSYIETSTETVRNVQVYAGIDGKLRGALGTEVTLFLSPHKSRKEVLVGLRTSDGRTYRSAFVPDSGLFWMLAPKFLWGIAIVLLPFLGAGLLMMPMARNLSMTANARRAAEAIPGAITI
jgi:hypothetical protein